MVSSNAVTAWVTTWPRESPLRRAYARIARTVLTGSLKVVATVGSTAGTGALSPARLLEGGSQALPGHRMACDGWRVSARAFTRFAAETGNGPGLSLLE